MRVLILFLFTLLSLPSLTLAQKEQNIWAFGHYAGLNFNSGTAVPFWNWMYTLEGCASISHPKTGELLFYTNGTVVFDRTHTQMPNGYGLKGHFSSTQSALIVPVIGDSTRYYIFTTDAAPYLDPPNDGAHYSIVDLTLNSGLGDVSVKNVPLLKPATEKLTGVKHCNDHDYWIILHEWNSDAYYAYLVSDSGIAPPVVSHIGVVHKDYGSGENDEGIGYLKASPDGKKLVSVIFGGGAAGVEFFDFDKSTGVISNLQTLATGVLGYGASFSPDNTKLYVSYDSGINSVGEIYQWDLSSSNIQSTKTLVGTGTGFPWWVHFSGMQLGPDGKIYVDRFRETDYIGVINDPDVSGTACNFVEQGLKLDMLMQAGLPNFVESRYAWPKGGFLNTEVCEGVPVMFTDTTTGNPESWLWNFGDVSSGSGNNSSEQNPVHTYETPGAYSVTLITGIECRYDTLVKIITVHENPAADFSFSPPEPLTGKPVKFTNQSVGGLIYSWNFGDGIISAEKDPLHTYINDGTYTIQMIVTNTYGCSDTVFAVLSVSSEQNGIHVPNAFSPNGDGINDAFTLKGKNLELITFRVFNRWGELVYVNTDGHGMLNKGWDGTRNGIPQVPAVYAYVLRAEFADGEIIRKKGSITLLR